ncbi:MAG: 3-phosphoshikimate 1-carboxyvinyltransferase [Acidimicrobiia bacterium]
MGGPRLVRAADEPITATVILPGSKSLTIRALAAAALAAGRSHLYGALTAEDTLAMAGAVEALGASVQKDTDPWAIDGTGGHLRHPEARLDAAESALSARVLIALASLGGGEVTVTGTGSLRRRPMTGLVGALGDLGIEVHTDGRVPVTVMGRGGIPGGPVVVDCSTTSQFATALLIVAAMADVMVDLRLEGLTGSRGYIDMTVSVMRAFGAVVDPTITGYRVQPTGYQPADLVVEPDASSAVYPMLAAAITGGRVELEGLRIDSTQPDISVVSALEEMGCRVEPTAAGLAIEGPDDSLRPFRGDLSRSPDGALAIAVACLFAGGQSEMRGLGSLRHKESDRIESLATELTRLGATTEVDHDVLRISPGAISPATIDPHGDHRIAMAFAPVGLVVEGIEVADPGVVNKTWPGFWAMLDNLSG